MKKFNSIIVGFFMFTSSIVEGQVIKGDFMIGMYCFDYNTNYTAFKPYYDKCKNEYKYEGSISNIASNGIDPIEGFDLKYIEQASKWGVNIMIAERQAHLPISLGHQPDKTFIERCASLGMYVVIKNADIALKRNCSYSNQLFNPLQVASTLSYFGTNPFLLGYLVADEPSLEHFSNVVEPTIQAVKANNQFPYMVLLASYASCDQLYNYHNAGICSPIDPPVWIAATEQEYTNYVNQIFNTSTLDLIGFDSYPILVNANTLFFEFSTFKNACSTTGKNFFFTTTHLEQWDGKVDKNKLSEFTVPIYSSLLYGGKGIVYYYRDADADAGKSWDQSLDPFVKSEITKLNLKLRYHHEVLNQIHITNAFHYSNSAFLTPSLNVDKIAASEVWSEIQSNNSAKQVLGLQPQNAFIINGAGSLDALLISFGEINNDKGYLWVVNKSLDDPLDLKIRFASPTILRSVLDDEVSDGSRQHHCLHLEPGEGKLLYVPFANVNSPGNYCSTVQPANPQTFSTNLNQAIPNNCTSFNVNPNAQLLSFHKSSEINSSTHFWNTSNSFLYSATIFNTHCEGEIDNPSENPEPNPESGLKQDLQNDSIRIEIRPNPAGSVFTITTSKFEIKEISILDSKGSVIKQLKGINLPRKQIDVTFPNGVYSCIVLLNTGNQFVERLIISK